MGQEEGRQEVPVEPALIRQDARSRSTTPKMRPRSRQARRHGALGATVSSRYVSHRHVRPLREDMLAASSGEVDMPALARVAPLDRVLRPVHRWVWGDFDRRVRKLLAFGEVESTAVVTSCVPPSSRRIRSCAVCTSNTQSTSPPRRPVPSARRRPPPLRVSASEVLFNGNPLPGGHGLDDLSVKASRTIACSLSCTWRKRPPPAVSPSIGTRGRRSADARDLRRDPAR